MTQLNCTLYAEGPSDRALVRILEWALGRRTSKQFRLQWADPSDIRSQGKTFEQRLEAALKLYPCELLFIHRDADKVGYEGRKNEMQKAVCRLGEQAAICVVPVRTMEAWLLFDEQAIRTAVGNPNGRDPLKLPSRSKIESLRDPKETLNKLLRTASGLSSKRLRGLRSSEWVLRIPELIEDFSPLRELPAFCAFEKDLRQLLIERGWCTAPGTSKS